MQYHTLPCNTMQSHAIPCNTMWYHVLPCDTMQYYAIPCDTMQYHASLITADGAHHCPVGSIWLFFSYFQVHERAMFNSIAIVIKGLSWANPSLLRRKWNNQITITIKTFIWVLVSDTFKTYQNQPRKSLFGVFFFESCYWLYGETVRRRWSKSGSGKKPSLQWHSGSLTWKFDFERGCLLHQYS